MAAWNCAEFTDLAQKIVEKQTFHGIGEIFHFSSSDFSFLSMQNFHFLNAEYPFSEHRILNSQFRASLEFLSAIFEFSEHRISSFRAEFAFSELRILGDLFRAVFECKICIF